MICRSLSRVAIGNCEVMLKTMKTCQLSHFIEYSVIKKRLKKDKDDNNNKKKIEEVGEQSCDSVFPSYLYGQIPYANMHTIF